MKNKMKYRTKTLEQIGYDILKLSEEYGEEADYRQKAGVKVDTLKGTTRDLVAKEISENGFPISGNSVDIMKKAMLKILDKKDSGNTFDADVIRHVMNKTKYMFSEIERITKNIDKLSMEEKQKILETP